ncbi:hypothetical protein K438DRAFT_1800547 [Mycena galopus ATCC 62051]|nr:hypothetical protein K438DRAFT_1800547 [Mycena galopus ATCC 62051]
MKPIERSRSLRATTCHSMAFPPEIFEIILDNVDGDIVTLRMCSLVSSGFLHSSRSHIFRRVTLKGPPYTLPHMPRPTTPCCRFHRLVTRSPHIQQYVRALTITDTPKVRDSENRITLPSKSWMLDEPTLPLLIGLLPNLETFHLLYQVKWARIVEKHPAFESAMLSTLASPKIKSIHLRGVGDLPLSCIIQSPGLKDLDLDLLGISGETNSVELPKVRLCRLGLGSSALSWFAGADCFFDTTHLLKLRIAQDNSRDQRSLQTLLDGASRSLLEFEYVPYLAELMPPDLDLGRLSSLQSLVIWVTLGRPVAQPFSQLLWLARVLDSLPKNSATQRISIHLRYHGAGLRAPSSSTGELAWTTLDASLTRPELRAAKVTIFTGLHLNKLLPTLTSSGRLRVDPFIRWTSPS